jgi:hypothetical protein
MESVDPGRAAWRRGLCGVTVGYAVAGEPSGNLGSGRQTTRTKSSKWNFRPRLNPRLNMEHLSMSHDRQPTTGADGEAPSVRKVSKMETAARRHPAVSNAKPAKGTDPATSMEKPVSKAASDKHEKTKSWGKMGAAAVTKTGRNIDVESCLKECLKKSADVKKSEEDTEWKVHDLLADILEVAYLATSGPHEKKFF